MKIVIDNVHEDFSGGGNYVKLLMGLFSEISEVYVIKKTKYHDDKKYSAVNLGNTFRVYDYTFQPDVYILVDYRGYKKPIGKSNIQVCFYPVNKNITGYKYAVCINKFVAENVRKNWNIETFIIEPYFELANYKLDKKNKVVLNIGNFFYEKDGHSKNQHLLLEWFSKSNLPSMGWRFQLIGFINNNKYFEGLKEQYRNNYHIEFYPNASRKFLLDSLAKSQFLIHAMGFGRRQLEQTEHFGLIAIEALLSGCQPIVHNSGGCRQIDGVITYNPFDELEGIVLGGGLEGGELRVAGERYNKFNSVEQARRILLIKSNENIINKIYYWIKKN